MGSKRYLNAAYGSDPVHRCHRSEQTLGRLSLTLLVLRVLLIDNVDAALTANNLVFRTALLYAGSYLHNSFLNWRQSLTMMSPAVPGFAFERSDIVQALQKTGRFEQSL